MRFPSMTGSADGLGTALENASDAPPCTPGRHGGCHSLPLTLREEAHGRSVPIHGCLASIVLSVVLTIVLNVLLRGCSTQW
jgi:hypothetical protein